MITTQKTIAIADGTIKLFATNAKDEAGNLVEVTPLKTLKLFRETTQDLMKLINTITAPNVSPDYYLPDDVAAADNILQEYVRVCGNYANAFSRSIDKLISALSTVDTEYFITKFPIHTSPSCLDIGIKIKKRADEIANEFSAIVDENNKYMKNLTHDMRQANNSAVLIAAPTLSAVLSNELTTARFNSKVSGYQRRFLIGVSNMINAIIAYQKSQNRELPKILRDGLQEVEEAYIREITNIHGKAAQKAWWMNLKEHPLDVESYITILKNESDICGLHEVAKYFEIEEASLKKACLNKLRHAHGRNAIIATKGKRETFFTNACIYFDINEDELTVAMYADIINSTMRKLCSYGRHIPSNAISSLKAGNNPHDIAQECIRAIVSQDYFVSLCEIAKEQLLLPLTEAFSIGKRSTGKDVYIGIIAYVEKKLVAAKKILDDTNKEIDELNRKKAEYENERKHAGLFAFSKKKAAAAQISKVESQIRAAENACQQKLNEL